MDYTMKSEIYEDISSDEESFEEDLSLKENNATGKELSQKS